jgi:anaerobic sulfite reductase subunit B
MATADLTEPVPIGAMRPMPYAVARKERETSDTWTLTLEPLHGDGPVIAPGQFMMVYVLGVGEVPISVSGPAFAAGAVVLTVRAVGAVSAAICASQPGATLGLRGPFGTAWPIDVARGDDVVVVAGGIGLAPLRSTVLHTLSHLDDYGDVILLYGARTPGDLLYTAQLEEWRRTIHVDVTVDAADAVWRGKVGVVPKLVADAKFRPKRVIALLCGPEIMMRFTTAALLERGVPPQRIHVSLERHMDCGVGLCGHCQLGPTLVCRDGPVYSYADVRPWLEVREL